MYYISKPSLSTPFTIVVYLKPGCKPFQCRLFNISHTKEPEFEVGVSLFLHATRKLLFAQIRHFLHKRHYHTILQRHLMLSWLSKNLQVNPPPFVNILVSSSLFLSPKLFSLWLFQLCHSSNTLIIWFLWFTTSGSIYLHFSSASTWYCAVTHK